MEADEFQKLVAEAIDKVPAKFVGRIQNLAFLIEEGTADGEILGLYQEAGDMPHTITLYRLPILEEATHSGLPVAVVVQETVWHEIAHYFGMDEQGVHTREEEGTNRFAE
ncbi:MAG: metallopeptidase family protein [Patescibacteria group bacterium]